MGFDIPQNRESVHLVSNAAWGSRLGQGVHRPRHPHAATSLSWMMQNAHLFQPMAKAGLLNHSILGGGTRLDGSVLRMPLYWSPSWRVTEKRARRGVVPSTQGARATISDTADAAD